MNFEALINYTSTSSLAWILITLGAFKVGIILYEKTKKHTLFQPIIVAYAFIIPIILLCNISYEKYFNAVEIIHFFLGPATVALALPLYKNFQYIKSFLVPLLITLFLGGIFSIVSAIFILWAFDAKISTILSMSTKSITAPIAIITSEQIGAISSLSLGFIVITGILGALFSDTIFKIFNIKSDIAQGFSLGLTSHAIGVAKSVDISTKATAFAALGMGLYGIVAATLLPLSIKIIAF